MSGRVGNTARRSGGAVTVRAPLVKMSGRVGNTARAAVLTGTFTVADQDVWPRRQRCPSRLDQNFAVQNSA